MLTLIFTISKAQENQLIKLNAKKNVFNVVSLKQDGMTINCSISELKIIPKTKKNKNFIIPDNPLLLKTFNEGMPNIPVISKLIELPQGADVEFVIKSFDEQIIKLSDYNINDKIMPAVRSQSKSETEVPFVLNKEIYNTNDYFNKEIAVFEDLGQMRDIHMGRIEINPIQYNPVKNILRVLNNLVIEIKFNNADMAKTRNLKEKYASNYFNSIANQQIINFEPSPKALITQTPTHLVIVSDRMFETKLADYIAWKRLKGFKVTVGYTDIIGSSKEAIKDYLKNIYENGDPMTFVLFVGDVQQIPAWPGIKNHVTDLRYCEYTGDDLPEVFYGRFSAQNTEQLQAQIDKTLKYERYEMTDPSYLKNCLLVAGDDENWEDIYGNGAIWYANEHYAIEDNGITAHTFLQDPPEGNAAIHDSILANVNAGIAFANYTAHCTETGWNKPGFQIGDVENLTNDEKYGLWIGNCCLSVKFDEDECFGEAALRKANGGAIGDIGGSNSTYWDEDFWWGVGNGNPIAQPIYENYGLGAYDGLFHTRINEADDSTKWSHTQSQMVVAGCMAVNASTSTRKKYYWEIYHLMGDPTLTPYLGIPQEMVVATTPKDLVIGMTSLHVKAANVPYAYIALSQNGTLIQTVMTDINGDAELTFPDNALTIGEADLVITCQNRKPYIEKIQVKSNTEPYIQLSNVTTDILPEYGKTLALNVELTNIAAAGSGFDAQNIEAELHVSDDTYISINNNTASFNTIAAADTVSIMNAFNVTIAENVPDQYAFNFTIEITGQDNNAQNYTWEPQFIIVAKAPKIKIGNWYVTNDDNMSGVLDAGETGDINFKITNEGHAKATFNGTLEIAEDPNNYLTLDPATMNVSDIEILAGADSVFSFTGATADANTPTGSIVELQLNVSAGENMQYADSSKQDFNIGNITIYPISIGGSVAVCEGAFYDSGLESGNYANNEDHLMTFLPPGANDILIMDFVEFATEAQPFDLLYVYDGEDTNAEQIPGSPFYGTNGPGRIISPTGLTFHFTSDNSLSNPGWKALISCHTPTSVPSCATNPEPANGAQKVFPSFARWAQNNDATSYDVYFGTNPDPFSNTPENLVHCKFDFPEVLEPNTTYYWAVVPKNHLGSASNCEVWSFTTGGPIVLMQNNVTITTCNATFCDNGGYHGNYTNQQNMIMTFKPEMADKVISMDFIDFEMEIKNNVEYDYIQIYDGLEANEDCLIGKFGGTEIPEELKPVTATNPEGALTVRFFSDELTNRRGWVAAVSCVKPTSVDNLSAGVHIIPNPNKGLFTLKTEGINTENSLLEIYSLSNKLILEKKLSSSSVDIDLTNQTKGLYFIRITTDNKVYNSKLIIR